MATLTQVFDPAHSGVPLSDMIETLRRELQSSMTRGAGQAVAFDIDKVELELKVAISQKAKGEGGLAFWVIKAGASLEGQSDTVHTFKLSLKPVSGTDGKPIKVSAEADARRVPTNR